MNKEEIENLSDELLIENLIEEAWDAGSYYRDIENRAEFKQELLNRLSKNKVEFEKDDMMLAQYFEKHIEYKEKAIEEYKKKLVEESKSFIKEYFVEISPEDRDILYCKFCNLINKIE